MRRYLYKRLLSGGFFLLSFCISLPSYAGVQKICKGIEITGEQDLDLNETEKKLICGDDSVPAWSEIPLYQAKYHLRIFLQARGYHSPLFKVESGVLKVNTGQISFIREVKLNDPTGEIRIERRRGIKGSRLTPDNLDKIEKWLLAEYRRQGYACPDISLSAYPERSLVSIDVSPGDKQLFGKIKREPIKALRSGVMKRYYAFGKKDTFNMNLLTLTEDRINLDGIVQNNYFLIDCRPQERLLKHRFVADKPRLFGFGAGFNTEEYFLAKVFWRHSRLSSTGSQIDISVTASYRKQEFKTDMKWYIIPQPSRFHLNPQVSFMREFEEDYHTLTTEVKLAPATTWDNPKLRLSFSAGPAFQYIKVISGTGLDGSRWLSLESEMSVKSHDFELFAREPRSGYFFVLTGDFNSPEIVSPISLQKIDLRYTWLFNPLRLFPPILIFGIRGGFSTTVTDSNAANLARVPGNYLNYLGGSRDLRGFSRQELPEDTDGALFTIFSGLEVRLANFFPFYIEPIAFFDMGALGLKAFSLDKPLYYSAGGGLRWASPFGALRMTFARGFTQGASADLSRKTSHFQFYLSFGEEF